MASRSRHGFLPLALIAFVAAGDALNNASCDFPFREAELVAAFSLVAPEDEARRLARDVLVPSVQLPPALGLRSPEPDELCSMVGEDVLLLLSLVSEDLNSRVAAFRREVDGSHDEESWTQRQRDFRAKLELAKTMKSRKP